MQQKLRSYREVLVEELKVQGITSQQVLQAFARVPRHSFVQAYYERQAEQDTWVQKVATDTEEWYQRIYSNRSFVTLVDPVGRSMSSSSQPCAMAQMLSVLDVHPGQRILEIGTGTGYNAAMLACLTGDPSLVITIDIEARITEQAQKALSATGYGAITVLTGDRREGYAPGAPYDRIIATASTPTVPVSWKEQLSHEGILVAVLQPGIAMGGGVLQAIKHEEHLLGQLLYEVTFMPLHDEQFEQLPSRVPHINMHIPVMEIFSFADHLFDPKVIWTPSFQFFLYATYPKLQIVEQQREPSDRHIYTLFFDEKEPDNYISFFKDQDTHKVEMRGKKARALWTQLIRAYTLWNNVGQPAITTYHFEMDREEQWYFLQGDDGKV